VLLFELYGTIMGYGWHYIMVRALA